MRAFAFLIVILCGAFAFEQWPEDDKNWASNQIVWVDCTSGSDSVGDGSNGNPYLTINNAMAQTTLNANIVTVAIQNGPCNEAQVVAQQQFSYFGVSSGSRPVVTNGFSYSAGQDYANIVYRYLEIGTIDIDYSNMVQAGAVPGPFSIFFGCKINGGTVVGTAASIVGTTFGVKFIGCVVTLASITGYSSLVNCNTGTLTTLEASSSLLIQGGTFSASTAVHHDSNIRIMGNGVGSASFTCTGTGAGKPNIFYGSLTTSAPTTSSCTVVHSNDSFYPRHQTGTLTVGGGGTVTTSITQINGAYNVVLTPTNSAATIDAYVSAQSSTSFTVTGTATATYNYVIVKA